MALRLRLALLVVAAASVVALGAGVLAAPAAASQLIDRNASDIHLAVNGKGEALITYRAKGRLKHVLAWNAVNAIAPTLARRQVAFSLDYAGGWGKYRTDYWKTFAELLPPLRRAGAGLEGDGLHRARRLALGSPGLAARASRPGPRARRRPGPVGASALALDRRAAGSVDPAELGLQALRPPLRHAHLCGPERLRLPLHLGRRRRSTASAATSTSTPTTRRTGRAGSARTAF